MPFPFTDHSASKKRPAVIVSNVAYNEARPDVVVMAITSQLRPGPVFGEVWVQDWQAAGLLKPSAIKRSLRPLNRASSFGNWADLLMPTKSLLKRQSR